MASKEEVLEKTKALIKAAQDLSAHPPPPNPFDAVSGTPALDALKLNGQVISDADLAKLLGEVEKAKTDQEAWKKVAGTIGGFLGGLAKGVILPLLAVVLIGCSTPPPIKQASQVEYEALVAFKADHDAMVAALFSDLALALETQVRLIEDYEIKAKGATVAQADLMALLGQARTKREELTKKLDALRAKLKTADRNFEIALQIQQSIDAFLNRSTFNVDDVAELIGTVYDLKAKQGKP